MSIEVNKALFKVNDNGILKEANIPIVKLGGDFSAENEEKGKIPVTDGNDGWSWDYAEPNIIPRHLPTNSEYAITKIGNAALSYIQHKDDFVYGGHYSAIRDEVKPVNGKWEIACSIFAIMLVYGITYDNSAYKRGSGNNILDPDCCTDLEMWDWFRSPNEGQTGDYKYKYSYDLAEWCYNKGYCFKPNEDLSNIKPGDLLFMKNQLTYDHASTYKDIDHTAIFGYWKTDNTYVVWEVGILPDEATYLKENLKENCVLVARFPYANKEKIYEDVSYFNGVIRSINTTVQYIKIKNPKPNQYYTFIGKIESNANITDAFPAIYYMNERLGMYDGGISKPEDDIYIIPFRYGDSAGDLNLRMLLDPDNIVSVETRVEWYHILEGLHFSKDRINNYHKKITIYLNSDFSELANSPSDDTHVYGFNGTFQTGITEIGRITNLTRHGEYMPLINNAFDNGEMITGIEAYVDYRKMTEAVLKVKNFTGHAVTCDIFCIIPVLSY